MNAYEIVKNGLDNELDEPSIIDELQLEFPNSRIENNIFILEETKSLLESPPKHIPNKTKLNYFLVKHGKEYIDIGSGRKFKPFIKLTYSKCNHGLCKKLNTLVLKNVIKKSHNPSVFVALEEKPKENNIIKIKYQNENKKQQIWEFDSQEINRCIECIDEGLSDRQIAVALFCPKECIQKLIKHIDTNQKMSRGRNGQSKNKNRTRMDSRRISRETKRESRSNHISR